MPKVISLVRGCTPGYSAFLPLCSYSEYMLFICLSPSPFLWASRSNQENIPKLYETNISRRIGFIGNGAIVRQSRGWEQQEATRAGAPLVRSALMELTCSRLSTNKEAVSDNPGLQGSDWCIHWDCGHSRRALKPSVMETSKMRPTALYDLGSKRGRGKSPKQRIYYLQRREGKSKIVSFGA